MINKTARRRDNSEGFDLPYKILGLGQQADGTSSRKDFRPKFKLYIHFRSLFIICKALLFKILGKFRAE